MIPANMRNITGRFLAVWHRNWIVYLRTWKVSFLPPVMEPILYVAAFGIGFRMLVQGVPFHGREISYVQFIAPGLIATGIMNGSFFETTFSSFVRMYYQKTFDATMAAPVSLEEVITGEIVWGTTRSVLNATVILTVLSLFNLIAWPQALLLIPVAVLGGLAFAVLGMTFTGIVKNIDLFNVPTFLLITPMFLFSGTFFPLDSLPHWAQLTAQIFPLTHLVTLCREISCGTILRTDMLVAVIYLTIFSIILFPLSLHLMRRRLIR